MHRWFIGLLISASVSCFVSHPASASLQLRQDGWFRMALRPPTQWLLPTALACMLFPAVIALTAVTQVSFVSCHSKCHTLAGTVNCAS